MTPIQPKVSVCVPVYNTARFLTRCLESLRAQTLEDLEVVIVDDGSTDASPRIIEEFAASNPRTRTVRQENRGLGATRNAGLRLATGEFVAFLDSDDWVEDDCYEVLHAEAASRGSDLVVCDYTIHLPAPDVGPPVVYRHPLEAEGRRGYIRALLERRVPGFSWNKLHRRSLLASRELRFPLRGELENLEDQYYSLRAAYLAGTVSFVHRPLVNYRIHSASIVQRYQPTLFRDTTALYRLNGQFLSEQRAEPWAFEALDASLPFGVLGCVLNECKDTNPKSTRERLATLALIGRDPLFRAVHGRTGSRAPVGGKVGLLLWLLRLAPTACTYLLVRAYRALFLRKVF